jgi:hypothetical protein
MTSFLLLSVVDPAIAGLKEGKKCRERALLTLPPDSDRNEKSFYENPIQSVKPEICAVAAVVSPGFSVAHMTL